MANTVESVKQFGVLVPAIVRPREEGGYEIVAGHRRHRASELAGKTEMPAIVRDLDDDEATIIMVDTGRLGATSLYGRCQKISAAEAKPGDLIFFQGTIPGEDGITHVGIYVGDGFMLHCGSPIGYADLSESYWQNHYFGYGRLTRD